MVTYTNAPHGILIKKTKSGGYITVLLFLMNTKFTIPYQDYIIKIARNVDCCRYAIYAISYAKKIALNVPNKRFLV